MTPRIYDISTDDFRECTQEDVDKLLEQINNFHHFIRVQIGGLEQHPDLERLRLAAYQNPWRPERVFIAEDKPIEPYPSIQSMDGTPVYPTVPKTPWSFPVDLAEPLARRIIAAVNFCIGMGTEQLEAAAPAEQEVEEVEEVEDDGDIG